MKKPALDADDEWFLGRFQGEEVGVVTTQNGHDENGTPAPLTFYGTLVHMDSNYIYLGVDAAIPTHAISRKWVISVMSVADAVAEMNLPPDGTTSH